MNDLVHRVGHRLPNKGRTAREQVIKNGPQRIHVAGPAHLTQVAAGLLRWHVVWRAENLTRYRYLRVGLDLLGQTEISDMRDIQRINQDIRGFDIAVQNALFVGVMNGLGNGFDPFGGLLG